MAAPNPNPIFMSIADLPVAEAKTGVELIEVIQDNQSRQMAVSELSKFNRYDLSVAAATAECNLAERQAFNVTNTAAGTKALSFTNAPAGRALTAVVKIFGKVGTVTWPAGITWSGSTAPELGAASTIIVLYWDGSAFTGSQGATV